MNPRIVYGRIATYRCFILVQHLIIFGHSNTEYDRGHVFEAVNPFLSLRPLAADVEQSGSLNTQSREKLSKLKYLKIYVSNQTSIQWQRLFLCWNA